MLFIVHPIILNCIHVALHWACLRDLHSALFWSSFSIDPTLQWLQQSKTIVLQSERKHTFGVMACNTHLLFNCFCESLVLVNWIKWNDQYSAHRTHVHILDNHLETQRCGAKKKSVVLRTRQFFFLSYPPYAITFPKKIFMAFFLLFISPSLISPNHKDISSIYSLKCVALFFPSVN